MNGKTNNRCGEWAGDFVFLPPADTTYGQVSGDLNQESKSGKSLLDSVPIQSGNGLLPKVPSFGSRMGAK